MATLRLDERCDVDCFRLAMQRRVDKIQRMLVIGVPIDHRKEVFDHDHHHGFRIVGNGLRPISCVAPAPSFDASVAAGVRPLGDRIHRITTDYQQDVENARQLCSRKTLPPHISAAFTNVTRFIQRVVNLGSSTYPYGKEPVSAGGGGRVRT